MNSFTKNAVLQWSQVFDEDAFAMALEKLPCLFDKASDDYKNTTKRDAALKQLAHASGLADGDSAKRKLQYIKTQYSKHLKEAMKAPSGSAAIKPHQMLTTFSFLGPYVITKRPKGSFTQASLEEEPIAEYLDEHRPIEIDCSNQSLQVAASYYTDATSTSPSLSPEEEELVQPPPMQTPFRSMKRPAAIPPGGGKKSRLEDGLLSLAKTLESRAQLTQPAPAPAPAPAPVQPEPRTEIDFFGDWIGAKCKEHCRGLSGQELIAFQSKILHCFID